MNSAQSWAEALKISPEKLSKWSALTPAGEPLLVWCLANGHISCEEYLQWACENFGLPILNSAFFHQSFDRKSLTPELKQGPWTAWCFPVGQWEDVAIIACVEPPADPSEGKCCFVLADPMVMNEVWGHSGAEIDAPIGINPNATRTFVLNLDDLTSATRDASAIRDPNPVERESHEKTAVTLSVILNPNTVKTKAHDTVPPLPAAATAKTLPTVNQPPSLPVAKPPAQTTPAKAAQALVINEDSEVRGAFERLKVDYQAALIMRCSETAAKLYKWDPDLKPGPSSEASNVNLSYPSFFRIVAKTMQPYHGYIVESPTHREFFESLDIMSPPACVTAVPLKSNEKLWGILVAFGGEAAQTAEALNISLEVAEKLTKSLETTWAKTA